VTFHEIPFPRQTDFARDFGSRVLSFCPSPAPRPNNRRRRRKGGPRPGKEGKTKKEKAEAINAEAGESVAMLRRRSHKVNSLGRRNARNPRHRLRSQ
jgi:hypothetical protein